MPLHPDVEMVVEFLLDQGLFTVDDCTRLAQVIRGFQAIASDTSRPEVVQDVPPGEPETPRHATETPSRPVRARKQKRGRRPKPTPPREELERLYRDEGLTAREIAERIGVATSTINARLRKYGIARRSGGRRSRPEAERPSTQNGSGPEQTKRRRRKRKWAVGRDELEALRAKHSIGEIAEMHGVSSATVNIRLREFGLVGRGRSRSSAEPAEAPKSEWSRLWGESKDTAITEGTKP